MCLLKEQVLFSMSIGLKLYIVFIITVTGLVLGSFLNCMAMRIANGEDFVRGRSHCMHCGHVLGAKDLIPVISYVLSGGRCRYCSQKISVRYPASELLFAAILLGVWVRFGFCFECALYMVLSGILFTLSIVDLMSYEIPDGFIISGVILWILSLFFPQRGLSFILNHLGAGVVCGGAMLIISLVLDRILQKESLGGGDIKLYFMLGLYIGWIKSYMLVLLSCVIGLVFAGAFRAKGRGETIPFGPSIAMAFYVLLLFGDALAGWYLGLLS